MSDFSSDSTPRESDFHHGYLVVHWRGYVKDSGPTQSQRANGRAVIVCDGEQDEMVLRPTAYPHVPEPWTSRCIKYAIGVPSPMCGGREGRRFLTNGHWQCVVDEATFQGGIASGWRDVGDQWFEPAGLLCEPTPLVDLRQTSIGDDRFGEPRVVCKVGDVWIGRMYVDLLRDLGVTQAYGIDSMETNGMLRVVVPGVAVVMGIRDVLESK